MNANEWQPIETAPKDGTEIDLWTLNGREPAARFNVKRNRWEVIGLDGFDTLNWVDVDGKPTHWMPLPAPPKDGE